MHYRWKQLHIFFLAVTLAICCGEAKAQFGDWPDVYDPFQFLTLHLEMSASDWQTVQNDETLSIEVPTNFWADGESPILVSVRRKGSAGPLTNDPTFAKCSLKIDINDFVVGQAWHGLKKLSLEAGEDEDVLSEGFAWQIERLASGTQGYGYDAGHVAWVRVIINGIDTGVYTSVEQRDKRFLENRGVYVDGQTWLYKVGEASGDHTIQVGGPQDSPTYEHLCYSPFAPEGTPSCSPPSDLVGDISAWVNVKGLLTLMASDSFQANPDALLTKGKNFYYADFLGGRKRMYLPWDRDSSISGGSTNATIYGGGSAYDGLLNVSEFRSQYNQIFNDLICGPWSAESLHAFLDASEAVPGLTAALAADLNNVYRLDVTGRFESLHNWVTQRVASVTSEIQGFQTCPSIQVHLNEFMATNVSFLQDPAEPGEFPDWFELHNPGASSVDLGGLYLTDDLALRTKYQIPFGVTIPANGHLVFYADEDPEQGPVHTNFRLAATGEVLAVVDANGVSIIDSIAFGAQFTDVSYGRYPNGTGPWGFMSTPTPGATNSPHNAPPVISNVSRLPSLPTSSDTVWVRAMVTDDGVVTGVTLHYNTGGAWTQVAMLDNGLSNEGAAGDDVYGASIPAQATNTIVKYYVSAQDDFGAVSENPANAPLVTHTYVVGYTPPSLYINEFMADNDAVIEDPDEPLAYEDWIEIYNAGGVAVDMTGMYLTDDLTFPTKHQIQPGVTVPAGGRVIFWADDEFFQGASHLNFRLSAAGESIGLYDTNAHGNVPIDTTSFGIQSTNVSQGRCPDGANTWQFFNPATPGAANQPCGGSVQACCRSGGSCEDLDSIACANSGGAAQGAGTTCATVQCPECVTHDDCTDTVVCTIDTCSQTTNTCQHTPVNSVCSDGAFCNGAEVCDVIAGCESGSDACPAPLTCDEAADACQGCTSNAQCNDGLFCNGVETCNTPTATCQAGTLVDCTSLDDACHRGVCDEAIDACVQQALTDGALCDDGLFCTVNDICLGGECGGSPLNCGAGGACDEGTDQCIPGLASAVPASNQTLWRSRQNIVRFTFGGNVPAPAAGAVSIRPMLAGGQYGGELSAGFEFVMENDGGGNPRILRILDVDPPQLVHRQWYAIRNTGAWSGVANFTVHYLLQIGDANNDGQVLNLDAGLINGGIPNFSAGDADRRDNDGDGRILNGDVVDANGRIPSFAVPKPSGH